MRWYLWCGVAIAATVCGFSYWQFVAAPAQGTTSTRVPATPKPGAVNVPGIGYVEPASEVRKLMLRTGGVVRCCFVKAGDRVHKGEKLLELDNATQTAEVAVARKKLELAQAEAEHVKSGINPYQIKVAEQAVDRLREKVRFARAESARSRKLVAGQGTSAQEQDAIETQLRQAEVELKEKEAELLHLRKYVTPEHQAMMEAKVRHAHAGLELAEERLRETMLLAPFDGVVLKVLKREGEGVRMFEPETALLFGDLSGLNVRAEIDERFVASLAVGQEAVVDGRNLGGKTYRGKVVTIEPIMGDKTVFTRMSSERKDLDVLQVVIEMEPGFRAPTGLQVDVKIRETRSGGD